MNVLNNRLYYKKNSKLFSIGIFNSFDGSGVELGFSFGGVHLKLPFFLWRNDLDLEELTEKNLFASILEFTILSAVSSGVNYLCKFILSRFTKFRNLNMKRIVNQDILTEKRKNILKKKEEYLRTLEILNKTAEKYHQNEIEKKERGLIIHLSLYGKFEKLEKYKKDFDYLANKLKIFKSKNNNINTDEFNINNKIKEFKVEEECNNIENEIIDVTLPVRNKISSNIDNTYSSIFFRESTKASVFGFYNPIFKSEDIPYILIMYI